MQQTILLERPTLASRVSLLFQLRSAKFQTFAYKSRTIAFSLMKSGRHFEINKIFFCTEFRDNSPSDLDFNAQKPPRKFGVNAGLI